MELLCLGTGGASTGFFRIFFTHLSNRKNVPRYTKKSENDNGNSLCQTPIPRFGRERDSRSVQSRVQRKLLSIHRFGDTQPGRAVAPWNLWNPNVTTATVLVWGRHRKEAVPRRAW